MVQIYAIPQMQHLQPTFIFQQDGVPPHWVTDVRAFLNTTLPDRWIGSGDPIAWLPRSPDVTKLDFSFGTTSKTKPTQGRSVMLKTFEPQ
ncbi:hypothetical protein AVEN_4666-1 [Araneus ventricosus]|uniref:Uncharacterized protein n=1 Tax=Araneus ventricosus TaxID=182803 RepID=A0A4Y2I1E8_ARAVE|nr:hypothetical protein AVEN_4666-1 [Araneus ventricosus]